MIDRMVWLFTGRPTKKKRRLRFEEIQRSRECLRRFIEVLERDLRIYEHRRMHPAATFQEHVRAADLWEAS